MCWAVEVTRAVLCLLLLMICFMLCVSTRCSVLGLDKSAALLEVNCSIFTLAIVARSRCFLVSMIYPVLFFCVGVPLRLRSFALISYFGRDLLRLGRRGLSLVAPGR